MLSCVRCWLVVLICLCSCILTLYLCVFRLSFRVWCVLGVAIVCFYIYFFNKKKLVQLCAWFVCVIVVDAVCVCVVVFTVIVLCLIRVLC